MKLFGSRGPRTLARVETSEGPVAADRAGLDLGDLRLPWEQIQAVDWDAEEMVLEIAEVGRWGEQRPQHRRILPPGPESIKLLAVLRERVQASIVLQRRFGAAPRGLRVIGRRSPAAASAQIAWWIEYDDQADPADPEVTSMAAHGVRVLREETGQS